jgi:hypothetical protein
LQPTEGGRRVVLTEHGRSPQWAPDGSRIFFYRHAEDTDARGLYSVLPTGGEARWCGPGGEPFSVSPDGTRIAWAEPSFWELPDSTPVVVAASLDNPSLLDTLLSVKPYSRIDFFQWLGGGGQAYVSEQLDSGGFLRRIHGLDGGAPAVVLDDVPYLLSTNLAPEDEGVLFLSQEDRVTWTPLPSGPARELTQFSGVSAQQISLSADGLRLAYSRTQVFTHLNVAPVQADGTVGDPRVVSPRTGEVWYAALSPDGGAVAYVLGPAGGSQDLFVVSTSGGEPTRVTFLEKSLSYPVWSGDGSTLGFAMQDTSDTLRYVTVPATGGPTKTLASYPLGDYPPPAISDSGDTLFFPAEAGGSWTMVMASEGWQQELYPVSSWWTSTVFPSRGVSVAYIEEGWSVRALGDGTVQDSVKFDRSVLPGSGWATTPTLWTEDGWLYFSVLFQTERRNSETWYQEVWRVRESGGVAEPALRGADGTPMRFPDPAFLMISSPAADQVAWISSERYSDVWIAEVIDSIGGRR